MSPTAASEQELQRLLNGCQLPGLPQTAVRILQLAQDPDSGPAEFATPIEADPGLASQVLRFVNSSYFGFHREISSVKLAITLVGVRTIKNFTLWSAVFSLMPNPRCGPFELKCLWQDSIRRAIFARNLARSLGLKDGEEPFVAALLQDMAVPLLAKARSADYAEMFSRRGEGKQRLSQLEQERFGWTHATAAGHLARHWNLPEELIAPIENHASLSRLLAQGEASPSLLAVALSSQLPAAVDGAWPEWAAFERDFAEIRTERTGELPELLAQVDQDFGEFALVLKVAQPARSLADLWREAASTCAT